MNELVARVAGSLAEVRSVADRKGKTPSLHTAVRDLTVIPWTPQRIAG